MIITVHRHEPNAFCTIGDFLVDDGTSYKSMELPLTFEGTENVPDKTCIPAGTYQVIKEWSDKHGRLMPRLVGVPSRTAIEIHAASCPQDLLGCTAIGNNLYNSNPSGPDSIVINESQEAFGQFYEDFLNAVTMGEKILITYSNDF